MVATGRVPNTKTLGLENMGIEPNRGFVQVGEETKNENAVGFPRSFFLETSVVVATTSKQSRAGIYYVHSEG